MSLDAIRTSERLSAFAHIVDASIEVLGEISAVHRTQDDRLVALQYLSAQIMNSASAALSVLLSGYYQQSSLLQRHMIEVGFLLDYLRTNPDRLKAWLTSYAGFSPPGFGTGKLIGRLDQRDHTPGGGRKQTYEMLSNVGAHPTKVAWRTIMSEGYRMVGPFFNPQHLEYVLSEMSRNLPYFALVAVCAFQREAPALSTACDAFRTELRAWLQRCYGGFRILLSYDDLLTEYSTKLWGRRRSVRNVRKPGRRA